MTSAINISNINIAYPIAGQDNDTQGFRDNFQAIQIGLLTASTEISQLQAYKATLVTAPATASSTGTVGQIAYDSTHFYVCVATDTWKRANLSTW